MAFDRRQEREIVIGKSGSVRDRIWQDNLAKGEFTMDDKHYLIVDHKWEDTGPTGLVLRITYLRSIAVGATKP